MTRCTCLWTAGREGTFAVLVGDPLCPAEAVHRRGAAPGRGIPRQVDPALADAATASAGSGCGCATELHEACAGA